MASLCAFFCLLGELAELFVGAYEVGFIATDSCSDGNIHLRQQELNPRRGTGNESDLSCELLHFFHSESLAFSVEGLEESLCLSDERRWYADLEQSCVDELSQDLVEV